MIRITDEKMEAVRRDIAERALLEGDVELARELGGRRIDRGRFDQAADEVVAEAVAGVAPKAPSESGLERARRLYVGRIQAAEGGCVASGRVAYGYRRAPKVRGCVAGDLVVHDAEAEVVRRIFRRYLARGSMSRVIDELTADGITTRSGCAWSRAGISWVLKNRLYLGEVRFGRVRARGRHPSIVAPIIFNKAGRMMFENDKRRAGRAKAAS